MNKITINTVGQLLDNVETEEKATKLVFYIKELQQENKQLNSILTELEEWLKERQDYAYEYENVLDKIQKLKEKYK